MTNFHQPRVLLGNAAVALIAIAWLLSFLMQIDDMVSDRHMSMGFYVSLSQDGTLFVDKFRSENDSVEGLQQNDIIVGIGANKFEDTGGIPRSQSAFRSAFLNAHGQVLIERGGQIIPIAAQVKPKPLGWLSLALNCVLCALGLLVAFFGKPNHGTRRPAMILLILAIVGIDPVNGPTGDTVMLSFIIYSVACGLYWPISINWLQHLAKPDVEYRRLLLPWLFSVFGIVVFSLHWGAPIPPPFADHAFTILYWAGMVCWFGTVFLIHSRLETATRQQLNWVLAGAAFSVTGGFAAFAAGWILTNDDLKFLGLFTKGFFATGFAMAILKSDFGHIDRVVSVSLTYAILVALFALSLEFFVEPLAVFSATYIGLPEETGKTILIVIVALGTPGLKKMIQPGIKNYFLGVSSA